MNASLLNISINFIKKCRYVLLIPNFFFWTVVYVIIWKIAKCHTILIYSDGTNLRFQCLFCSRRPKTHRHTHAHTHTRTHTHTHTHRKLDWTLATQPVTPVIFSFYYCWPFTDSQTAACPHTLIIPFQTHKTIFYHRWTNTGLMSLALCDDVKVSLLLCNPSQSCQKM